MMKRRTPGEKTLAIEAFKKSGLTQAAYARQNGLNPKTFSRWCRESRVGLIVEDQKVAVSKDINPLFIPVFIEEDEDMNKKTVKEEGESQPYSSGFFTLKTKGFLLDIPTTIKGGLPVLKHLIQLLHAL